MSSLRIRLSSQPLVDEPCVARIALSDVSQDGVITTDLSPLDNSGQGFENWCAPSAHIEHKQVDGLHYTLCEEWAFGFLPMSQDQTIEDATRAFYQAMFTALQDCGGFSPIRIWHYLPVLSNAQSPTPYQRFCAARAGILDQHPTAYCAATVIGTGKPQGVMYFLASKHQGQRVENPRQTDPHQYPAEYADPPPMFSRALTHITKDSASLYISGTASIIGHRSYHNGDVIAQADEILENLRQVIAQASKSTPAFADKTLNDLSQIKIYLKHPQDYPKVMTHLGKPLQAARFFAGEVCRPELLIEIEALIAS